MTRDAIPWTADAGTQQHYHQTNNPAQPMYPPPPFGGTAHLVPVAQGIGPPMSVQQQIQMQQQHQHHQHYQQQQYYQQYQQQPQQPQRPAEPASAAELAVAPCSECRAKDGAHRKGCSLAGSVLDRRRQKAAAELAKQKAKEAEEQAATQQHAAQDEEVVDGVEDAVTGQVSARIPQVCNEAYNLNPVLRENILQSDYFKSLLQFTTFEEVLEEIYSKVTYATPFIPNTRTPSSCFCLLMKFFQMKLTYRQLEVLLEHTDSPLIPVMGLLYIRYVVDPKEMWSWYEPKMNDDTEFDPGASGKIETIGKFLRGIIEDIHYYDTILPRIPVTIQRTMAENIMKLEFRTKAMAELRARIKVGSKVRAIYYEDHEEYEAKVLSETKHGTFQIVFTAYGNEQETNVEDMRIDPEDNKRDKSRSRSRSAERDKGSRRDRDRKRSRSRERKRDRSRSRSRSKGRASGPAEPIDWGKEVLKRQRDNAASKGGDYARRPTSYKSSLSCALATSSTRQRSPPRSDTRRDEERRRR